MSPVVRKRNIFDPHSSKPFKLSRSRLENFLKCPCCFYLDRRLGVDQPSGPPFSLNSAVDELLKKEFDQYRAKQEPHPLMTENRVDAIPFQHPDLDRWRENFKGLEVHHKETNLIISGAIDDVWVQPDGNLIIVDYKATSKNGEVSLDADWQISYKRQMEIYQWLMRGQGLPVSDTGYFVYTNGRKDLDAFHDQLQFKTKLIPYTGNADWVEPAIREAHACLMLDSIPESRPDCEFCQYREAAANITSQGQLGLSF